MRSGAVVQEQFRATGVEASTTVLVENGKVKCFDADCLSSAGSQAVQIVDLEGGSISPGLITYGSLLGLEEIESEGSTNDGTVEDPLTGRVPSIVGGDGALIRAVDGLQYGGRSALSVISFSASVVSHEVFPFQIGL